MKKITVPAIQKFKGKEKITCLTAYTTPIAKIFDKSIDLLLVGYVFLEVR